MTPIVVTGDVTRLSAALRRAVEPLEDDDFDGGPPTVVHFDGFDRGAMLQLRRAAALDGLRRVQASGGRFVLVTPRRRDRKARFVEHLALAFGRAHDIDTVVTHAGSGEPRPWRPSACGVRRALPRLMAVVSAHQPVGMTGTWSSSPSSPSS